MKNIFTAIKVFFHNWSNEVELRGEKEFFIKSISKQIRGGY